jgi:DNA invertase Pin-like site-specific DNA recombinase
MIVGYARVSTDGQSLEAQHAALKAAGATQIYSEKVSGAVTERKTLARAIAALWVDDVLMVTRLDRLGGVMHHLAKAKSTDINCWIGGENPIFWRRLNYSTSARLRI